MPVLTKICGIARRDRRQNADVLKELNIEKDIVQVLQTGRLKSGHVNRMQPERYPHGYDHAHRPKGRPKKKWIGLTTFVTIAPTWTYWLPVSLRRGRYGGTLFSVWTASARCHRHRRSGNKSSQSIASHGKQEAQLLLGDRATRKHAKDS